MFPWSGGIENPEVGRGIGAAAGHPLPTGGIVGEVGVKQRVPKPCRTLPPIYPQVLYQEARRDHADAIMHPTRLPKFPHAGIDERISGQATLPRLQIARAYPPRIGIEILAPILFSGDPENDRGGDGRIRAIRSRSATCPRLGVSAGLPPPTQGGPRFAAPRFRPSANAAKALTSLAGRADRGSAGIRPVRFSQIHRTWRERRFRPVSTNVPSRRPNRALWEAGPTARDARPRPCMFRSLASARAAVPQPAFRGSPARMGYRP